MDREQIIAGTRDCFRWWIRQRKKALEDKLKEPLGVNPFMLPFLFDFHNFSDFGELANMVVAANLLGGHNTGFGKLIDEKLLPQVFGAQKLDKAFRSANGYYIEAAFNEIDHKVFREDGKWEYLSLKSSKWTIQLSMAMQLNTAFDEIVRSHWHENCRGIVVGVVYGTTSNLTDKYDILRGINRGARHNVVDVTNHVTVYAGASFWDWLSGVAGTQKLVMKGLLEAIQEERVGASIPPIIRRLREKFADEYGVLPVMQPSGDDWYRILAQINEEPTVIVVPSPTPLTTDLQTDLGLDG